MRFRSFAALLFVTVNSFVLIAQTTRPVPSFSVRRVTAVTSRVVTGDFNGDGMVDLVSTSSTPASGFKPIVVATGRGNGTFNAPVSSGMTGSVLASGDFNKDGRLDLVAAADNDDMPLRMLPGRGDGTFGPAIRIGGAVTSLTFAVVADFDGDGNSDVAVGYIGESTGVLMYQGLGDGTFTELIARLDTGMNSGPFGGVVADLNRDGRPDVVVGNHFAKSLSIFLNQGSFAFTAADRQMAGQANDVAAADVNGDGKLDLIVAESFSDDGDVSYKSGTAVVYLGNGDGTIAEFGHFNATGRGAWRVITGDFNRDGMLDIVTANRSAIAIDDCGPRYKTWDSISVITGNGDGTFAVSGSTDYSIGHQANVDDPRYRNTVSSLAVADVNGDRAADLVASDGAIFTSNPPDPNWAPTVMAGPDRTLNGTHTVTLGAVADDVDQDVLRYAWDNNAGISIPAVPNPCVTVPSDGTFTFVVTVFDLQGHQKSATVHHTFTGGGGFVHPEVTVIAPKHDEVIPAGTPYTIRWSATAGTHPIHHFDVRFAAAIGSTPVAIPGCANLPASATSCTWNEPNPPTEMGVIQVDATPTAGPGSGTSVTIRIRTGSPATLPGGWSHADIGSVAAAGDASFSDGVFTVKGSGADIWGTADEFHFAYQPLRTQFEIVTRADSVQNVHAWTKAGLMVRTSLDPSAPQASIFVTPGKGVSFQRRLNQSAASVSTTVAGIAAPVWLRLAGFNGRIWAYYKKNLTDRWTFVASDVLSNYTSAFVGLAVTSHADGTVATATFSQLRSGAIPDWSFGGAIGCGPCGAPYDGTVFGLFARSSDIWGVADSFEYIATPIDGDATITVRVDQVDNTHAWAKAGIMFRETKETGSRNVFAMVTPGNGVNLTTRDITDGMSARAASIAGTAPGWLRLQRAGHTFTMSWSTDGLTFVRIRSITVVMLPKILAGMAFTSHNTSVSGQALFEEPYIVQ